LEIKVNCLFDKMVKIEDLKENPKNRNGHPQEQIDRLAKILEYQGWRWPIKVSNQTGFISAGHGRLLAAKHLGNTFVPVNFQDYEDYDQEYSDMTADNAIARWSDLDLAGINSDIGDLGPDLDIDMLGLKDFRIDVSEIDLPDLPDGDKGELEQMTFTISNGQALEVKNALNKAMEMGPFGETGNENRNGNALARICEWFLNGES